MVAMSTDRKIRRSAYQMVQNSTLEQFCSIRIYVSQTKDKSRTSPTLNRTAVTVDAIKRIDDYSNSH